MIDAYALSLAALLLTAGSIADLAGRRRVFAIGIVIFTARLGALRRRAERAVPVALPGRCRASAARSCSRPRWRSSPRRSSRTERGVAFGAFGAITGIAVAVGPVLGGAITSGSELALDLLRQRPDRHLPHTS